MRDLRGHIVIEQELHRISSLIRSATFCLSGLRAADVIIGFMSPVLFTPEKQCYSVLIL